MSTFKKKERSCVRNIFFSRKTKEITQISRRQEITKQGLIKKNRHKQKNKTKRNPRINDIKNQFFEKITETDKSLAKLTKRQLGKIQINKIGDKRRQQTWRKTVS